jgi:glycosyltransferase involved in cell wall biosynthesis
MIDRQEPLVSVVLRTYQHGPLIAQAIESVLVQRTSFPFELVIGEDCSTDGTREIVEAYGRTYPGLVRPVLPERNVGHGEVLRRALEATQGPLIAYLDGDDYWTSARKLARQVEYMDANPDCHDCFHDVSLIYDEAGVPSGTVSPGFAEGSYGLDQILMECFVPAPAMMIRRGIFEELEPRAFESAWLDWILHVQAATHGPLGYLPEPMAVYRVHRGGMFSALDRVPQLEEDLVFYARLRDRLPDRRELIDRCLAYRGAQLAVERLGVSYEACVVLVDPRHEFRPYFNGRHARGLPRREGREVTELEAIRAAARTLPRAVMDYGSGGDTAGGSRGCLVVVPTTAAAWLEAHESFGRHLEREGKVAWEDAWVTVHELPPLPAAPAGAGDRLRRVSMRSLIGSAGSPAAFFDAPHEGAVVAAHATTVTGWVVGDGEPARAIEFETSGELLHRAPVARSRPDVVAAFPAATGWSPGFQTTFNAIGLTPDAVVEVNAVLADGTRLRLAELTFAEDAPADDGAGR